ncbi:MAG: PEP-utilizing enzyme, partial [Micrococcales bacterium]|nr:PEP-utilizing enzyme [Micrococcales bacterium]
QMAVAFDGRMYYRLDSWYHLLQVLPFSTRIIAVWQRSLGVAAGDLPEPLPGVGWTVRARVLRRLVAAWRATPQLMAQLDEEFAEIQAMFDANFDPTDTQALRNLFDQVKTGALRSWDITLVNDLRAFGYTALARRLGKPVAGVELVSVAPLRALAELRSQPDVADLAQLTTDDEVVQLIATGLPLGKALGAYLDAWGDRGPGELKLESQTFRTHPMRLVHLVLSGSDVPGPPPPVWDSSAHPDEHQDAPPAQVTGVSAKALAAIAFRESSRLNRARLYGMVRAIVVAIGHNLARSGMIDDPADVFCLTLDEVLTADGDLRPTVAARTAQWAQYAQMPTRSRIVLDGPEPSKQHAKKSTRSGDGATTVLGGTVVSAGTVEAEVVVVTDPSTDATGKIVVAVATDPGWVFVLADAAGIITERGSMLSHTAIVARELGLPALVGVADATSVLRTGDRVRLDATRGRVEVLARA